MKALRSTHFRKGTLGLSRAVTLLNPIPKGAPALLYRLGGMSFWRGDEISLAYRLRMRLRSETTYLIEL